MKIIKYGNSDTQSSERMNKPKRFTCRTCGCEFEANRNEYDVMSQYNEVFFYCKCPNCGQTASGR